MFEKQNQRTTEIFFDRNDEICSINEILMFKLPLPTATHLHSYMVYKHDCLQT